MALNHTMDSGELSLEIDVDQGARISSIRFRDVECAVPFRGQTLTWVGMRWRHGRGELRMV